MLRKGIWTVKIPCIYYPQRFPFGRRGQIWTKSIKEQNWVYWQHTPATDCSATANTVVLLAPCLNQYLLVLVLLSISVQSVYFLWYCTISKVCQLPPAVRTSSPAFNVLSSGLLCGWTDGLELATWHCLWSNTFVWQYLVWFKKLLSLLVYIVS